MKENNLEIRQKINRERLERVCILAASKHGNKIQTDEQSKEMDFLLTEICKSLDEHGYYIASLQDDSE